MKTNVNLKKFMIFLITVLVAGNLGILNAHAAETAVAPTGPAIDALIQRLENTPDRERLITDLKTLKSTLQTKEETEKATGMLAMVLDDLVGRLATAGDGLAKLTHQAGNPFDIVQWATEQATNANRRALWLSVVQHLVLVVGSALIAAWIFGKALSRPKAFLETRNASALYIRAPLLLARTVLDLIPLIVLMLVAYGALAFSGPERLVYGIILAVVHAIVAAHALTAIARALVTPFNPSLRLFELSDETSAYTFVWLIRLIRVPVYGFFAAQIALNLGLPVGGYEAAIKLVGLAETILLIVLIMQIKNMVASVLQGSFDDADTENNAQDGGATSIFRKRLAEVWHYFALIYVLVAFIIWALEIEGGFAFVATGTIGTAIVIGLAIVGRLLARLGLTRLFSVSDHMKQRYPLIEERANKYLPAAQKIVSTLIWLVALLLLLRVWQFDVGAWLVSDLGRLVIARALNIVLILGLALAIWEGVSGLIIIYLDKTDDDGNQVERSARVRTLLPLAKNALLVIILTMASLTTLSELGVNIGPLLAGAGVIGLAIGFGAQTLVKDIITGAFILVEDSIAIGDFVTVGGLSGTVEAMTIRAIRLRDPQGTVHTVPFSSVETVTNMTRDYAWHVAKVGVAYREDIDEVYDVLREIGAELQADPITGRDVLEPISIDGVDSLDDSAVVVRARLKTKPGAQWRIKRAFNDLVKRRFDEHGIEIPYPHQTIYFGEDKKGMAPALRMRNITDEAEDKPDAKMPETAVPDQKTKVGRKHRDANDDSTNDSNDGGGDGDGH